jgi:hypothetical protein
MGGADNLQRSSFASSIEEAKVLVRECAKPRPTEDNVKAAILRASRRLRFAFSRTKDIWYGAARRIDAEEMDRLRKEANEIEIACAIAEIEVLRNRMLALGSPDSQEVVVGIDAALGALGRG